MEPEQMNERDAKKCAHALQTIERMRTVLAQLEQAERLIQGFLAEPIPDIRMVTAQGGANFVTRNGVLLALMDMDSICQGARCVIANCEWIIERERTRPMQDTRE